VRAARFLGGGRVRVDEVETPSPAAGELLVRVHSNALCGSDRAALAGGSAVIPGHEISGRVAAHGAGVSGPPVDTCGIVYLVAFCGRCAACARGATNVCVERHAMYGFTAPGGLADYVCVRAECFLPLDADVPLDHATSLLDLFGTTLHALRRGGLTAGERVGVIGCGPIGLGTIAVARALGAGEVYAVDVSARRRALAELAGATPFTAGARTVQALHRATGGGCDVVVEAAGLPETQRQALESARAGGRVVAVAHSAEPVAVRVSQDLIAREISLFGSEYFRLDEHADALGLVRSGRLDPAPLITHRFALDEAEAAYRCFLSGETGKVLVQP
jgi:threonine 3-dehydrogenase